MTIFTHSPTVPKITHKITDSFRRLNDVLYYKTLQVVVSQKAPEQPCVIHNNNSNNNILLQFIPKTYKKGNSFSRQVRDISQCRLYQHLGPAKTSVWVSFCLSLHPTFHQDIVPIDNNKFVGTNIGDEHEQYEGNGLQENAL